MKEKQNNNEDMFRVTMYDGDKITEKFLSREEVLQLDPTDVDLSWDRAFGKCSIRRADGKRVEYTGSLPGVGDVSGALLLAMMRRPGQLLSRIHLMTITNLATFERNSRISQRMSRLRVGLCESADSMWFFKGTRDPFTVGWNIERTWRIIEAVVKADGNQRGER